MYVSFAVRKVSPIYFRIYVGIGKGGGGTRFLESTPTLPIVLNMLIHLFPHSCALSCVDNRSFRPFLRTIKSTVF